MTVTFTKADLDGFSGTEKYYRSSVFTNSIVHTDGVEYVATRGGGWMVDVIVSHQIHPRLRKEEFQVWDFHVHEDHSCRVVCTDGNEHVIANQIIEFTDLTFDVRFYLQLGSIDLVNPMWVIMLPSEY